jgi:hypothetical protein
MKNLIVQILLIIKLGSCQNNTSKNDAPIIESSNCTNEMIISEFVKKSLDSTYLSEHFKMDKTQYLYFCKGQDKLLSNGMRERLLDLFAYHITDTTIIQVNCSHRKNKYITVGDLALFCAAKLEVMPFALATGNQNCSEPNISKEITIPINFYKYTDSYRTQSRYQEYLKSEERIDYLKDKGYN